MPLLVPTESPMQWWQRWRRDGDIQARDALALHYLPYARTIAAICYARRIHDEIAFEEYLQYASLGLLEAMERFDPQAGVQFKTFASKRMHGAVLDGLDRFSEKNRQIAVRRRLRQDRVQALAAAAAEESAEARKSGSQSAPAEALFRRLAEIGIGLALGVLLEDTGMVETPQDGTAEQASGPGVSPEVRYFQKAELQRLRQTLHGLVGRLPGPERNVIRCHYLQEMPFDEIAARLGVTRSRVSQLHRRALLTLREMSPHNARIDASF